MKRQLEAVRIEIKHGAFGYSGLSVTKLLDVDGSVSICPLTLIEEDSCMTDTYSLLGRGVNSTTYI